MDLKKSIFENKFKLFLPYVTLKVLMGYLKKSANNWYNLLAS